MKTVKISKSSLKSKWNVARYIIMPSEPKNIEVKYLYEVAKVNPESRYLSNKDDDFISSNNAKLIQARSVNRINGKITNPISITGKDNLPKRARLVALKEDILFPTIKSKHVRPILIEEDKTYVVSDYFVVIVPKRRVNTHYLIWALEDKYVMNQLFAFYQGSYNEKVNITDLKQVKIKWLERSERNQKSNMIRKRKSKNKSQNSEEQLLFQIDQLFYEKFNLTKQEMKTYKISRYQFDKFKQHNEWDIGKIVLNQKLSKLVKNNKDIKLLNLKELVNKWVTGIQYRDLDNIDQERLIKGKHLSVTGIKRKIKKEQPSEIREKMTKKDDVLLRIKGKVGPALTIKHREKGYYFYQDIVSITVDKELITSEYLMMYLNSYIGKKLLDNYKTSSSTDYIKLSKLKEIPVLVPSVETQKKLRI